MKIYCKNLDNYAMNHRMYRAEVIRQALEEFLRPNTTTYDS